MSTFLDAAVETIQIEAQEEDEKLKKDEQSLSDMWVNIK